MEHLLIKHKMDQAQLREKMKSNEADSMSYHDDGSEPKSQSHIHSKSSQNRHTNSYLIAPSSQKLKHSMSGSDHSSPIYNDIPISPEAIIGRIGINGNSHRSQNGNMEHNHNNNQYDHDDFGSMEIMTPIDGIPNHFDDNINMNNHDPFNQLAFIFSLK